VSWPGNLYATLFLLDPAPPARAPELSFVSALALHDALTELASGVGARLTLKWPNDLLLDGAKVAGILIEGEGTGGDGIAVAVGIGVNCVHHPADTPYPATDLASAGARVQPEALFRILSATMLARLTQWQRGSGFAAIRRDWLARADGVGAPIRVRSTQIDASGIFEDLDSSGRLVLGMPDGTRQMIGAGEVFPVLAASPFVQPDGARQ
jgi:BirA family biotin operon repressor/biotin-[acetyl-CoA-carboxylase] ligase